MSTHKRERIVKVMAFGFNLLFMGLVGYWLALAVDRPPEDKDELELPPIYRGAYCEQLEALDPGMDPGTWQETDGHMRVGFRSLINIPPGPDGDLERNIPLTVRNLDGQDVVIAGYMATKQHRSRFTYWLAPNSDLFGQGVPPPLNQYVVIFAESEEKEYGDMPVAVYGRFEVGGAFKGGAASLYRIYATKIAPLESTETN